MKIVNWIMSNYMGNQINYIIWIYNKLSLIVNNMMGVFVMYIFIRIRVFRVIFRVQLTSHYIILFLLLLLFLFLLSLMMMILLLFWIIIITIIITSVNFSLPTSRSDNLLIVPLTNKNIKLLLKNHYLFVIFNS